MTTNAFPRPFSGYSGHEVYNFLDGFNGYNEIQMHLQDEEKSAFVTEWGVFVTVVMMFELKTMPTTFKRIIGDIRGIHPIAHAGLFG